MSEAFSLKFRDNCKVYLCRSSTSHGSLDIRDNWDTLERMAFLGEGQFLRLWGQYLSDDAVQDVFF